MSSSDFTDVAACPVCGSSERRPHLRAREWIYGFEGTFHVVRCTTCGHGYLSPRPGPGAIGAYYPDDAYYAYGARRPLELFGRTDTFARAWYGVRRSVLAHRFGYAHLGGSRGIAVVLDFPFLGPLRRKAAFGMGAMMHPYRPGGRLLEIGCGSGEYLDLMRSLGWETVGVEMSESAAGAAREALGLDVHGGTFEEVSLGAASFDAISASHTLEHVFDPVSFLRKAHGLLRPGGRLAVVVPNADSLAARQFGANWVGVDAPRHLMHFTADSLRQAARAAGFTQVDVTTPPWGAYQVALFSLSRASGDPPSVYNDHLYRFSTARRLRALRVAVAEWIHVALGRPRGEVLELVARR